jgi:hypothetical protein
MVLCVRHIWNEQVNSKDPVHPWLLNVRKHIVGQLHGPVLGLIRFLFLTIQCYVAARKKIPQFNRQQRGQWNIEFEKESPNMKKPSFMGDDAQKLLNIYSEPIIKNEKNLFSLKSDSHWPLTGILDMDSSGPNDGSNLQHFLAAIYWLQICVNLSNIYFLKPGKTTLRRP